MCLLHYTVKSCAYLLIRRLLDAISDFLSGLPVAATNSGPFKYVLTHFFHFQTGRNKTLSSIVKIACSFMPKTMRHANTCLLKTTTLYPLTVRLADVFIFYNCTTSPTKMMVVLLAGLTVNCHD